MAASIDLLVPPFRAATVELLDACGRTGVEMRPNFTLRTPFEQARLWRQSRTTEQVRAKVREFRERGAHFLAFCLESVGPQHGAHVTNAPPGLSWHQWGEALDCFWVVDGRAEWSITRRVNGVNGYRVYADEATRMGLTAGGFWQSLADWPHVQLRAASGPGRVFPLLRIDDEMRRRFGP
ncbi:MAG TPA: M15 family metallopeptidase [Longimicrobiaceae bacterium]|nr:M15 family metallopeptidase [Longimicrobiaceae bacterium]